MDIKAKILTVGLAAATLFCSVSVSAATWTTKEVSGKSYTSPLLNYGDGERFLHGRGIKDTGTVRVVEINSLFPNITKATVKTKIGVTDTDNWLSKSKTNKGTPQSYQYIWTGDTASASANMRISDY
ncbi:hypothetical protein [Sporosarcina sp. SAFN-010]|uniref:hypothetical protein n=1 Tax=Sporosarcina sp. SAFN-010 TaxID=3387273 RepID=UPI003F7E30C2